MKKIKLSIYSLLLVIGCKNPVETQFVTPPVLTPPLVFTENIDSITCTSAIAHGSVTKDGGANIKERGFVWNTSINPTIDNNKMIVEGSVGNYTKLISELIPNTLYYLRAYAINSVGIEYGLEKSFTTSIIAVGSPYKDGVIISVNPNLYLKKVEGGKNWIDANLVAQSMGGSLPSVVQLQTIIYPMKAKLGLNKFAYWSSEEATDDDRFALAVIFNGTDGKDEGKVANALEEISLFIVVIFSF